MYLVLLVFGGVLTFAGLALAASGLSIHDHVFDMSIVTPGIVSAVGGLALIGLGMALRVLQRIEHALATRQMSRVTRPSEAAEPAILTQRLDPAVRIPLPAKTGSRWQPAASAAAAAPVAADENRLEDLPDKVAENSPRKSPVVARAETATIVEEMDVALSQAVPSSVDAAVSQFDKLRAARRKNGATPGRIAPRLDATARSPLLTDRPKGPAFETLWPKGSRPARAAQATPAQEAAAPAEPEAANEPAAEAPQTAAPNANEVSVLKSGVVDGMAYTLYSDGSIEADLPQGALRFGSITELRNHIEQSA
jgi:hypothetical protein